MILTILLPMLLPFGMALLEIGMPKRVESNPWVSVFRLGVLGATTILLLIVPSFTPGALAISTGLSTIILTQPLAFLYTNTGVAVAMVYLLSQAMSVLGSGPTDMRPAYRSLRWAVIALVVASCLAANIMTVCLTWTALALALFIRALNDGRNREYSLILSDLVEQIIPVILLISVLFVAQIQQRAATFSDLAGSPLLVMLLVIAAFVRMAIFPLPGFKQITWLYQSSSLCAGAGVYLRLAGISVQTLPGASWLVPLLVASALITALLANLTADRRQRVSFVLKSQAAILLIGPLMAPGIGTGLAILTLGMVVILVPIISLNTGQARPWPISLATWPWLGSLLILMGVPLSLGILTRWELQQLLVGIDQRATILLLTVTYTLITLSMWRLLAEIRTSTSIEPDTPDEASYRTLYWVKNGAASLLVLGVLILGIIPQAVNTLLPSPLGLPSSTALFAQGISIWIYPLVTTLILPFAGAFFILSQRTLLLRLAPLYVAFDQLLRLDWLYLSVNKLAGKSARVAERIGYAIESRYLLGWVLAWVLLLVAVLAGAG